MDLGVFIPIANNGWIRSANSPQYKPTFDLNREVTQRAEKYGFEFALAMVKLRGYGGPTQHWDYNLEPFTLISALAAVTNRIQLYATVPTLIMPPALAARMATTIDSVAPGRFGLNLITGWQPKEYQQMGMWPGEEHFSNRYEYLEEYTTVLKELLATGVSNFKGQHFTMDDCHMLPLPSREIPLVSAASSDRGMEFASQYCDYNFIGIGGGEDLAEQALVEMSRLREAGDRVGRHAKIYGLCSIIADETDEAAWAKKEHYDAGTDQVANANARSEAAADKNADPSSTAYKIANRSAGVSADGKSKPRGLIGSYETIAKRLDALAETGIDGVMFTFDDFVIGIEQFGQRIQPLMKSRSKLSVAAE